MPWKPFSFDDSVARSAGGGILLVPDGDYLLSVTKIEPGPEDIAQDKEPYLWVHFRLVDGPVQGQPAGVGREIRMVSSCKPGAQGRLGQVFSAIGRADVIDGLRTLGTKSAAAGRPQFPTYESFVKVCLALGKVVAGQQVGAELVSSERMGNRGTVLRSSNVEQVYAPAEYESRKAAMLAARPAPQAVAAVTTTNGVGAVPVVVSNTVVTPDAGDDTGMADQLESLLAKMAGESA